METVLEQMLSKYKINSIEDEKNAIKEILQELILCSLSKTSFFNEAIFCGGTALRVFYKLNRFSEDLDFSLIKPNKEFSLEKYLESVKSFMKGYGVEIEIKAKNYTSDKAVKSAFLKANTIEQLLYFKSNFDIRGIHKDETIKIKIEVDSNPPLYGTYENKYGFVPETYQVKIYDSSSLFAGKLHSILCRFHDNRIKGRDLYDYIFYISRETPVNITFLQEAMKQSGDLNKDANLNIELLKELLKQKFKFLDYNLAKQDVIPFIKNTDELKLWGPELFLSTVDKIM